MTDSRKAIIPQNNKQGVALLISGMLTLVLMAYEPTMSAIGMGWSLFLFLLFIFKLGKGLPVLELMLVIAAAQWIIGAKISYASEFQHFKYFMYVDEEAYMGFVVPGVIAFSLGILIFAPRYSFTKTYEDIQKLVTEQPKLAYRLIAIGLISTYLNPYMPAAIGFVLYLTAAFQYVGLALLLFQPHSKKKWIWFAAIMGALAVSSIVKGMFHDLILWSVLLFSYVLVQFKVNFLGKLLIILAGLAVAALIQSIKSELRSNKEEQGTGQRITLFSDLLKERIEGEELNNEEILTEMASVRLNQGWIISSILFNVPRYEPFADGETIMEALTSSILPRFLVPSKKVAGGRENFRQFSGLQISDGTSMGASVIGEAYANYGNYGGWIFMFIWGAFLAWGLSMMVNYGRRHPIIYVFIPLIFLQVIKAETELSVVLNHFVKSSLLVFLFLWGARNVLKWKI